MLLGVLAVALLLGLLTFAVRWLRPALASLPQPVEPVTWRLRIPRNPRFPMAHARAWFAALAPLFREPHATASFEIRAAGREVELRITIPPAWEVPLRGQLAAWFPEARLEPIPTEEITAAGSSECWLQSLTMRQPEVYPLQSAGEGADPLLGLFGLLTQDELPSGVRFSVSVVAPDWDAWAAASIEALQCGNDPPPRDWRFRLQEWLAFWRRLTGSPTRASTVTRRGDPDKLAVAEAKALETCLSVSLSVWAVGPEELAVRRCHELVAYLEAAYRHPFGNALAATGELARSDAQSGPRPVTTTLSVSELAALFHVPAEDHPLVPAELSRQAGPPPSLSRPNPEREPLTYLGEALTPEGPVPFGLTVPERRFHTYVVGKTGTGKSTLLAHLLRQDLEAGHGCGLIDPHGDLAELVLSLVPPERYDQVIYFNPADVDYPIAFNLLMAATPEARPLVASGLIGVFKKLYGDSWGPRLEHILRNSVLALLEAPEASLLALPRLLVNKPFREHVLTFVQDPVIRSFFRDEFASYDPRWRMEAVSPILNKVGQFLASPVVRNIVGQSRSAFDLREVMDDGGIFIANLASGKIGEDNTTLLGGLLVTAFQLAAMHRSDVPESERRDFFLFVDEFQHFANDAFQVILSEARKYRLSLTLSHQYLDQVPPSISDAVFGNVNTLCAFTVGAQDAALLAREFAPGWDAQDLTNLPPHHFLARLHQMPSFSARTPGVYSERLYPVKLQERSRQRWARSRVEVELQIVDALERSY